MTISRKVRTNKAIETLLNLSTSHQTFMILRNPDQVDKKEWFWHLHCFGLSFVYFSLHTEDAQILFGEVV